VAEHFHKRHSHIIRDIETKILPNVPNGFTQPNFGLSTYKDTSGKENKFYRMTRDGFTLLVMGFTGKEAMEWKGEIEAKFPGYDIHVDPLSLSVACHIGPGALAFACCKKIEV